MNTARWARTTALALLVGAAILSDAASAAAQRPLRAVGEDLRHVGEDVLHVWTSPLRGTSRDWLAVAGVGAAFAAIMPFDDNVDAWARGDSASALFRAIEPFRAGGGLYTGNKIVPYAAAAYVVGIAIDNRQLRDGVMGCAASYATTAIPRRAVYRLVGRTRPEIANGDQYEWNFPGKGGGKNDAARADRGGWFDNSFPGGHFANLMGCAAFLGKRFEMGYAEPVVYGLALAVGLGRLADRAHWASDQFAGGALGYAAGRTVAIRQLRREHARREQRAQATSQTGALNEGLYVVPGADRSITVGWARSF